MLSAADWIRIVAIVAFTLTAAITDTRFRRIPNWLTVPAFLAGLAFHVLRMGFEVPQKEGFDGTVIGGFYLYGGLQGLLYSLGGFAVGFGILFVLLLIGGGAAGDVKLMGAVGAWLGPKYTLFAYFLSVCFVVLGSVLILLAMVAKDGVSKVRERYFQRDSKRPAGDKRRAERANRRGIMTYALPVALGTWLVLAWLVVGHKF